MFWGLLPLWSSFDMLFFLRGKSWTQERNVFQRDSILFLWVKWKFTAKTVWFWKIPCFCGHLQLKTAPFCPWCFAPTLNYFAWVHKARLNVKQSNSHINWILIAVSWLPAVPVTYWPNAFYLFLLCCLQNLVTEYQQLSPFESFRWTYYNVLLDLQIKQDFNIDTV